MWTIPLSVKFGVVVSSVVMVQNKSLARERQGWPLGPPRFFNDEDCGQPSI